MNENLNLIEILKDCPKGWKLYSPIFGEIEFYSISENYDYPIILSCKKGKIWFSKEGLFDIENEGAECLLFPSKDQRDWSKFTAPWYKKEMDIIAKIKKQGKPKPYSGVSFKHIGHIWDMRARDGGVEIFVDGEIKVRVFLNNKPRGKSALEAIKEEKVDNANKVEPKFKVGDWIVWQDKCYKVNYNGCGYELIDQNGLSTSLEYGNIDKNARLWTIQDAKDGDVLVHSSFMFDDFIFIYNNTSIPQAYCYYSNERNRFIIEDRGHHCPWNMQEVTPVTKEQRDLLFQKMKEAGYEWDADKKELKKLVLNRFDPKTLKPFDKVLVRDDETCIWKADFYSHKGESRTLPFKCVSLIYKCCIPYNEDTKHLVGTKEEAPEYYRYWED